MKKATHTRYPPRVLPAICALSLLLFAAPVGAASRAAGARATYARLPLLFEPNQGQADRRVLMLAHGPGYTLLLTHRAAVIAAGRRALLRLEFSGSSPRVRVAGDEPVRARTNYLLGADPKRWVRDVPNYAAASYRGLYEGIDARFYGSPSGRQRERLELDLTVAPGADPRQVVLRVPGARLRLDARGDALIESARAAPHHRGLLRVVLGRPRIYQRVAGVRREVAGRFVLRSGNRLALRLGPYDRAQRLIIDPTLDYSTYVANGQVSGLAIDGSGHVYLVGSTQTGGIVVFPSNAYQSNCAVCVTGFSYTAFVAKYDPTQSGTASLIYSTYLGPQGSPSGGPDALGGAWGQAIAVDSSGDAFVTGYVTGSAGLSYYPTTPGAYLPTMAGTQNAFVSELDPTGTSLIASTYLGGDNSAGSGGSSYGDQGTAIALDKAGEVYIAGLTDSPNLATPNAPQSAPESGFMTGTPFAAKLNPGLGSLLYFTYLGGSNNISGISDTARGIAVDGSGDAFVVGGTYVGACNYGPCGPGSPGFPAPLVLGYQSSPGGVNESGYLVELNPTGTQVPYLTFLGGGATSTTGDMEIEGVTLNAAGDAYVTGTTTGTDLPTTGSVVGAQSSACSSSSGSPLCPGSFVAAFNPTASGAASLLFLSYLGGVDTAGGAPTHASAIALDSSSDLYIAGTTSATDMPLPGTVNSANGLEPSSTLSCAAVLPQCISPFLVELAPGATRVLFSGYLAGSGGGQSEQDSVTGMAVDASGNLYLAGLELTNDFPVTTNGYDQQPPASGSRSSYLAVIGGASSGGTPSVATFTLNGLPPSTGGLFPYFAVSAPATTSLAVPVLLTNSGGAALTLTGVSLFGSASPPWTLTGLTCNGVPVALPIATTSPVSLAPGQSCTIGLQFAPTATGPEEDEGLAIYDDAPSTNAGSPAPSSTTGQFVTLQGTPTAAPPPAYASYTINGTVLSANLVTPATSLTAEVDGSASTEIDLTNTGGLAFAVTGASLTGTAVAAWSITSFTCPGGTPSASNPVTLYPGSACAIDVTFAPTTSTSPQDVLFTVLDSAAASNLPQSSGSGSGQSAVLQGLIGIPDAQYSASQLNFGNVAVGNPAVQTVTVTNDGTGPLEISSLKITVSPRAAGTLSYWSLSQACGVLASGVHYPITIAPGSSCAFAFQLDPAAPNSLLVALVTFADNAPQSNLTDTLTGSTYNQQVKLYGVGVVPLSGDAYSVSYEPTSLAFTSTSGIQTLPVTVSNTGTQPLIISSVQLSTGQTAFQLPQSGCTAGGSFMSLPVTLASQGSCTFNVEYDPAGTTGGTPGGLSFFDNGTYSNVGSTLTSTSAVQGIELLAPGQTLALNCGSTSGIAVSTTGLEALSGGWWSTGVTLSSTVPGYTLPYLVDVFFEGLTNASITSVNSQPATVLGYTPSDPSLAAECGNLPDSPYILVNTSGQVIGSGTVGQTSMGFSVTFSAGAQPALQSIKAVAAN